MDSPDSRTRLRLILEVLLILALCSGLVVIGIQNGVFEKKATQHQVTLRVTGGSGVVKVTYSTSVDNEVVEEKVDTPWEKTLTLKSTTQVYLTAAHNGMTGDIECALLLDHKAWKKQTARSPIKNVACGGIVP